MRKNRLSLKEKKYQVKIEQIELIKLKKKIRKHMLLSLRTMMKGYLT